MRALERFAYKHCDYTISLLGGAKSYMVEHGLRDGKFVHIPNGLPEPHSGVVSGLKQQSKLADLYSGNHGLVNGLDNVIEAARILSQNLRIHFLLVGQGPEKEKSIVKARKNDLKNVTFFKPVGRSRMSGLTAMGDVGYIGLRKKDLFKYGVSPNKLFEYMASGLPIISAINTSNDEVSEAKCGFSILAENPAALASILTRISQLSKEQLCAMGKADRSM